MPPINSSSLNSGKHDAIPVANTGSLEGFIKYIGILASSSESQFAATVLSEITQQREQIQSQEEELKENQITINGMFKFNQDEKAKQQVSATQIETLRATVNEKESKIAEYSKKLRLHQQEIINLKSACSQEVAKVSQSAKDISTLQANLKERDKMIDELKTAGSKSKSMLSFEQGKNEELETANASMRTELQAVKACIKKLEDFAVQSSDVGEDFVEKDKAVWEKLRKVDNVILPSNFPLIPSNSPAVKAIRAALILAVLFREINQRIFRPSYFLSESNNLREALEYVANSNGEKEAYCRRLLLSIDPDAEQDTLIAEIQTVVQRMLSYVGGLFDGEQHDLFCTKIKTIVENAAELWLPIQRSRQKFETDFEPFDPEDNEWDIFSSAGKNTKLVAQDSLGLYVLNVFPCISMVEDGDHDPLTSIIQLRSSQELYIAAQHEASKISTSAITRRYSTRPRRQSTAGSNGKPFLGGNPAKV
ncbi:hypothetical protein N7481_001159 [Penicillium waksmanii]|uniref:uncharacterized protein n=1 Tax=Penicillium waksmanii TaxID=69791 RepID=UPI002549345F|nr:uncharacterized protein N7481_001159 [Penicillium waksmanii]KAJ6000750.1 hypothetical protein N7481_001159 [Penicillium waksmanii]